MRSINIGTFTADIDGDFVVFIVGARPQPFRFIQGLRDLGGDEGMKQMLDYLSEQPEKGLLGYEQLGVGSWVQYWRSFDHLEAFAKDADDPPLDNWRKYFKRGGKSGRTGIRHETFLVRAGEFEVIYTRSGPRLRAVPYLIQPGDRERNGWFEDRPSVGAHALDRGAASGRPAGRSQRLAEFAETCDVRHQPSLRAEHIEQPSLNRTTWRALLVRCRGVAHLLRTSTDLN